MKRFAILLLLLFLATPLYATTSGEEIYQQRCARCHEQANDRIPPREALQKMPAARILRALDAGPMMAVAFTMSRDDRMSVANFLGTSAPAAGQLLALDNDAGRLDRTVDSPPRAGAWAAPTRRAGTRG